MQVEEAIASQTHQARMRADVVWARSAVWGDPGVWIWIVRFPLPSIQLRVKNLIQSLGWIHCYL